MLNKKKIRTMSKIAVMEKHHGEELQKAREYYRSDYVAVQLLKKCVLSYCRIYDRTSALGSGQYGYADREA